MLVLPNMMPMLIHTPSLRKVPFIVFIHLPLIKRKLSPLKVLSNKSLLLNAFTFELCVKPKIITIYSRTHCHLFLSLIKMFFPNTKACPLHTISSMVLIVPSVPLPITSLPRILHIESSNYVPHHRCSKHQNPDWQPRHPPSGGAQNSIHIPSVEVHSST
jgi:hypothetical protein